MASFDASIRPQLLLYWMYGIWTMVFLHHLGVSILMYTKRNKNASNFIKIVFNFNGVVKAVLAITSALVPDNVTDAGCQALGYLLSLNSAFFRMSLSLFLLWRIKQIEFKRSDMYIGFTLFSVTSALQISRGFVYTVNSVYFPITNINACYSPTTPVYNTLVWISTGFDFAIDFFVTFRLVQILRRANHNARFVTSNMQRPFKRTLFTSVMYWNFLRLAISILYHIIAILQYKIGFTIKQVYALPAVFTFVYVALAYTITADAEIVRVIEGRTPDNEKGNANGTEKPSFKGFGFRRGPTSATTTKDSTDYIISTPSLNMTSSQQTEKVVTNTVAVSSMKRLSFFEWAKFVVGKKDKNGTNNNFDDVQGSMEEIEEKLPNNADPEYGIVVTKEEARRESDHSLATTVINSTTPPLKDNHDAL